MQAANVANAESSANVSFDTLEYEAGEVARMACEKWLGTPGSCPFTLFLGRVPLLK